MKRRTKCCSSEGVFFCTCIIEQQVMKERVNIIYDGLKAFVKVNGEGRDDY